MGVGRSVCGSVKNVSYVNDVSIVISFVLSKYNCRRRNKREEKKLTA